MFSTIPILGILFFVCIFIGNLSFDKKGEGKNICSVLVNVLGSIMGCRFDF